MKHRFTLLAFLLVALAVCMPAAPIVFTANLDGLSESPANDSLGTGFTTVTVDLDLHTMRVEAEWANLTGLTTVAHIHIGRPTGGVVTTTPTFPGFPAGVSSGTYDRTFDLTLPSTYNPAFLNNGVNMGDTATAEATLYAGMLAGDAYLNIHSSYKGGGEIRGFLEPVPEPATMGLAAAAFGLLALGRRFRRAH